MRGCGLKTVLEPARVRVTALPFEQLFHRFGGRSQGCGPMVPHSGREEFSVVFCQCDLSPQRVTLFGDPAGNGRILAGKERVGAYKRFVCSEPMKVRVLSGDGVENNLRFASEQIGQRQDSLRLSILGPVPVQLPDLAHDNPSCNARGSDRDTDHRYEIPYDVQKTRAVGGDQLVHPSNVSGWSP